MNQANITNSSPLDSPTILVFGEVRYCGNLNRITRLKGIKSDLDRKRFKFLSLTLFAR